MKTAKLKKLVNETQAAHHKSSAELKKVSRLNNEAKKRLKLKKKELSQARKEFKSLRKTCRELEQSFEEIRARHLNNNKELAKLMKKLGKANPSEKTRNDSQLPPKRKTHKKIARVKSVRTKPATRAGYASGTADLETPLVTVS